MHRMCNFHLRRGVGGRRIHLHDSSLATSPKAEIRPQELCFDYSRYTLRQPMKFDIKQI